MNSITVGRDHVSIEKATHNYIKIFRSYFQTSQSIAEAIDKDDAQKLVEEILSEFKNEGDDVNFSNAVKYLIDECRKLDKNSRYITVNSDLSLLQLRSSDVYQPPSFLNDKNELVVPNKILHPGISSTLALSSNSEAVTKRFIEDNKEHTHAIRHLEDVNSIRKKAIDILTSEGILLDEKCSFLNSCEIKFGKEYVDGITQSPNFKFHRSEMYGVILANRIRSIVSGDRYFVREIKEIKKSTFTVYSAILAYN